MHKYDKCPQWLQEMRGYSRRRVPFDSRVPWKYLKDSELLTVIKRGGFSALEIGHPERQYDINSADGSESIKLQIEKINQDIESLYRRLEISHCSHRLRGTSFTGVKLTNEYAGD